MWIVINASSECFFAPRFAPIRWCFYRKVMQTPFYFLLLIIFQTGKFKERVWAYSFSSGVTLVRKRLPLRLNWKIYIQGAHMGNASALLLFAFRTRRLYINDTPVFMTAASMLFSVMLLNSRSTCYKQIIRSIWNPICLLNWGTIEMKIKCSRRKSNCLRRPKRKGYNWKIDTENRH